jgi:hypothetical protein
MTSAHLPAADAAELRRVIAEASMVCHQAGYHDLGDALDEKVAPHLTPSGGSANDHPTRAEDEKLVAEWRVAMEGVTAGEWGVLHHPPDDYYSFGHAFEVRQVDTAPPDKHHWPVRVCTSPSGVSRPQPNRDGDWIARCSPSGISGLLALIESQRATIERVERENTQLRAALAQSDQPCAYCSLAKDEWAKCASGFPGCSRADDAMGCPELGASLRVTALEAEKAELRAALISAREQLEGYERDATGETYNDTQINSALAQPSTQENDNGR